MDKHDIIALLDGYRKGTLQPAEEAALLEKMAAGDADVREALAALLASGDDAVAYDGDRWEPVLQEILAMDKPVKGRVRPLRKWGWAAAAAMLALLAAGLLWTQRNPTQQAPPPQLADNRIIKPGSNKALLILSDGSSVTLDSAGNRVISQAGVSIRQQGGGLQYGGQSATSGSGYNTLSTPRGGQFRLELEDGTRAWLNAASSIRYPAAFTGKERVVDVTGEVYLEIAKDASKPFRVNIDGGTVIEVLGTSFNINAYKDESSVNATLVEGAVKISTGSSIKILAPGQQARVSPGGDIHLEKQADISQATAWKEGLFNFHQADLSAVMKQLARWYDVDIVYEGKIPETKFWGKIKRNLELPDMLEFLRKSGVNFRMEGRKIIVMP